MIPAFPAWLLLGAALGNDAPAAGIYANEEEVYFAREQGRAPPPWLSVEVDEGGKARSIDSFGNPVPATLHVEADGREATARTSDGKSYRLRRARTATCWGAVLRHRPKADGSEDWYFVRGLKLHDQGGRAAIGGDTTGSRPVVVRMRNVVFPEGSGNRPSLVLYVHEQDADRAVSYAWADPGAMRIGINLRWMQTSCTIDDEPASASSPKSIKGGQ